MKKRICIVINSLVQGGAQKSAILLSVELKSAGHDVQLLTFYPEETDFFKVPDGIHIERFIFPFQDNGRVNGRNRLTIRFQRILNRFKDFKNLRKSFINFEPDLVISFEAATSVLTFFANYGQSPQIISERVHPEFHLIPRWAHVLRPFVYRSKHTILHCQGSTIAEWMKNRYKKNIFVIPNLLGEETKDIWNSKSKKVKIFSRYAEQKGIDLAINAWSLLPKNLLEEFQLEVFGDGDRSSYLDLVSKLNVDPYIKLNGPTKNMHQELSDCLLYVLPSRFEGFPNALAESIGYGIPSLATDSPSAIRDLTINGKLAKLSHLSSVELAKNIEFLLSNQNELEILNSSGKEIRKYFNDANTLLEWTDLISWILSGDNYPIIQCKACQGKVKKVLASRTRAGIRRELISNWDIAVEINELGSKSVIHGGKCSNCGSMNFDGEQGNKAFYDSCYKSKKYSRNSPWDYQYQLKTIAEADRVLKVLDFGGGISPFATQKLSQVDLTVVDLSPIVREELESLKIKTHFNLSEIPKGTKFDHINLSHTIEHVDNPIRLITSLIELLNNHGKIYITTPDADYPYLLSSPLDWPPHHTIEFTHKAILEILKNAGVRNFQVFRNPYQNEAAFDFMVCGEL